MKLRHLISIAFALMFSDAVLNAETVDIIPTPARMTETGGTLKLGGVNFVKYAGLDEATVAVIDDFAAALERQSGLRSGVGKAVVFTLDKSLGEEAYRLVANKKGVKVSASSRAGFFYAIQTLKQMLPTAIYGGQPDPKAEWVLPCVEIDDKPQFSYRGFHMDPCRHFFTLEETKKLIDLASMYKMNRMHWHLTEDQGWRIEIKKYPLLTQIGSKRPGTQIGYDRDSSDGIPVEGYYTQEEVKDLVGYAFERCITIVPEVDLPGHMLAALAAYPELGCTDGPYKVWERWGISPQVLCPAKPQTMQFLKDVVGELADLFPGEYFHIGGDECPKTEWEQSELCQALIDSLGLVTDKKATREQRLQNWVTRQMQDFLATKGKKIIGWDEILEGELSQGATVMSWRGAKGGIQAANAGYDVIMTPSSHLYFDYAQTHRLDLEPLSIVRDLKRVITWQKTYSFDPYDQISEDRKKHIIGVQANHWTEYIATAQHLEYMMIPRIFPLVELQWSPAATRDEKRLERSMTSHQLPIMDRLGYNYHPLDLVPSIRKAEVKGEGRLKLLYWNIQDGMWADQGNNYDNFVSWVKSYDADVCVWCEARTLYYTGTHDKMTDSERTLCRTMGAATDEGWNALAERYGHKYVYIGGFRDNYPQVITSKYPITNVKRIVGDENGTIVSHGAGWATIDFAGEKVNIVTLHAWPQKYGFGLPADNDLRKASAGRNEGHAYRAQELKCICENTILSQPDPVGGNWMMIGDFNSPSPRDHAVYRCDRNDPRFECQSYILGSTPYVDVIGERNPGKFLPSTYGMSRIDYVYCTPKMYDRIVDAYTVVDEWTLRKPASDHRPIYVEFQF